MCTLLLVEPHPLMRQGLAATLEADPRWCLAPPVTTGAEACEAVAALSPDLVITEIRLPDVCGLDLVQHLVQERSDLVAGCRRLLAQAAREGITQWQAYAQVAEPPSCVE